MRRVEALPSKLRAAVAAGVTDVVVPQERGLPTPPAGMRLHPVGSFAEAILAIFGGEAPAAESEQPPPAERRGLALFAASVALLAVAIALWGTTT